jgi:predicted DCC family thiol-disulfide oxidoreductase YuxK
MLGFCRMLFFGGMFLYYLSWDFTPFVSVSDALWYPRVWFFDRLDLPILSPGAFANLQLIWRAALVLGCVGLFTRLATAVSFVLSLYILGLPNNFGTLYHYDTIVVLAMAVLAASRCGDAWSVDALVRRARHPAAAPPAASGEYRWPLQLIRVVMALTFFAAGVAKIRHGGLEWVLSDNMAIMLVQHHYHIANADPLLPLGLTIAQSVWLASILAAVSMLGEAAFPAALFSRHARAVLVPSIFGMQVGIRVLLGPTFNQYLICNLFWMPWRRVGAVLRRRVAAAPRYTVIVDGDCGLCMRTAAVIRGCDVLQRVDLLYLFRDWPVITARFPGLDPDSCASSMHVLTSDGRQADGFDGYRLLCRALPLGWLILPALFIPGVPQIGRRVYAAVAARRATTCAIPGRPGITS